MIRIRLDLRVELTIQYTSSPDIYPRPETMEKRKKTAPFMGFMALHYDFPYTASQLYCKTCKKVTTHNWNAVEYTCSVCGRIWDDELLRVSLKQDQYGKLYYECIRNSDRPVNSSTYPSTKHETLEACLEWFNNQVETLRETIEE